VKRWIFVAAAVIAAALAFASLRGRLAPPEEEIDDASKQALRDILKQDEEQAP